MSQKSSTHQSETIKTYVNRCRDELETGVTGRYQNAFQMLRLRFDDLPHPFMRRVDLHLPGDVKLHGLLALKGDLQTRPFVVLRLGIFGNIEEFFAESFVFRQLFEQGPFNMLVVESTTSKRYLANNPAFSLGGALEGPQNLQIARLLRDPKEPLSQLVETVHFVGMSLGGHGLFHVAALDSHQGGLPLINSHLGLCPVVRLRDTVYDAIRPGLEGTFVDAWFSHRTPALRVRVPELRKEGWGTWWRLQPFYWRTALDYAARSFPTAPGLTADIKLPSETKSFWEASEPWAWFKDVKSPVLVMATRQDEIVPVDLNAQALVKELYTKKSTEDVSVVVLDRGYHCTLPVAYHWDFTSALLNSSVLASTTKSFEVKTKDLEVGQLVKPEDLGKMKTNVDVSWAEDRPFPMVKVWVQAPGGLTTEVPVEIPRSDLDFRFLNPELSEAERTMGVAWLSRNLKTHFVEQDGRVLLRLSWSRWSAGSNSLRK
ncbi:MAG: hypothetical protein KF789_03405 [Bdellovibrionaceae bacterium]|nr:hypothetical protein [Pseudobdellovibrionaceae bacterium]